MQLPIVNMYRLSSIILEKLTTTFGDFFALKSVFPYFYFTMEEPKVRQQMELLI